MRLVASVLCGVVFLQTVSSAEGRQAYTRVQVRTGIQPSVLVGALDGAVRRLKDSECQKLLTDFRDPTGRTLLENLQSTHKSLADYLTLLWFIDGREDVCKTHELTAAFTTPGSRVIQICGARLADPSFSFDARQFVIIHELLHSLGLGENPPSSAEITRQVIRRCARG
jgi:hypothetical protein